MNLKQPLIVDFNGLSWRGNKEDAKDVNGYAEEARKSGHDGFIARNVVDVGYTDTDDVPLCTDYVALRLFKSSLPPTLSAHLMGVILIAATV